MDRSDFEVVLQVGTGCAQRWTSSQRGDLIALPAEPPQVQVVLVRALMVNPSVGGLCRQSRKADDEVLLLITCKIERLILDNWPAHGESVVFVAQPWSFCPRRQEWRTRAVKFIPVVVVERTVNGIAAGFGDQVHRASSIASRLGT